MLAYVWWLNQPIWKMISPIFGWKLNNSWNRQPDSISWRITWFPRSGLKGLRDASGSWLGPLPKTHTVMVIGKTEKPTWDLVCPTQDAGSSPPGFLGWDPEVNIHFPLALAWGASQIMILYIRDFYENSQKIQGMFFGRNLMFWDIMFPTWWFQPVWKICSSNWIIFPWFRGEK